MVLDKKAAGWFFTVVVPACVIAGETGARVVPRAESAGGLPICDSPGLQSVACQEAAAGCQDTYLECAAHVPGGDTIKCSPGTGALQCQNPPCVPINDDQAITPCAQPGP